MEPTAANIDIAEQGRGPSLIFTHGWTDDRTSWDGVVAPLATSRQCLSWSLRAHGASEVTPPGTYSREHGLADLRSVADRATAPYTLIGHSLGGYLSLAHALNHPDELHALVLVGAGPGFRKQEAMDQWNAAVDRTAAKNAIPEGAEVLSKHYDSWVMDEMATITAPTLVVIGEGDKQFMASAGVFEKRLDVRNTVVVPDAGHSVHRQQPRAVADAISAFLDQL